MGQTPSLLWAFEAIAGHTLRYITGPNQPYDFLIARTLESGKREHKPDHIIHSYVERIFLICLLLAYRYPCISA